MASKRQNNENIVNKCTLRQIHGSTFNALFPRSFLQPNLDPSRLCIPLREIQKDNSFAVGHVLLGFTKCGEYLLSYFKEIQELVTVTFGLPSNSYKYTMHWWKFNLRKPLQQVSHVSLFVGEVITDELLLNVCHTLNDNRILVHGCAYPSKDEQCKQCYVTICPSPPATSAMSCEDTWVVHMKYNLLPPFPLFIPLWQLKIKDTVILNTVDSILAITVIPCAKHKTTNPDVNDKKSEENGRLNHRKPKTSCVNSLVTDSKVEPKISEEEAKLCIVGTTMAVDVSNEVKIRSKDAPEKTIFSCIECSTCCESNNLTFNCDHFIKPNLNNNREIEIAPQSTGCSECNRNKSIKGEFPNNTRKSFSSFNFKTFSVGADSEEVENTSTSIVIDGTSYLDIQITTATDSPYKLLECLQDKIEMKDHETPCIHTRVVSLDVERYINEALNTSDELKGKYWLLRNYSTLLVDVCEGSQSVIMHVVVLISVQDNIEKLTKREISSFSLLLTWSIITGEVKSLNISSSSNEAVAKSDELIFKEGCKTVVDLRRKYFVPRGLSAVQVLSNHNVLTGKTLEFIKHPFQPIAIVL